jgi:hypothetical protein
MGVAHFTTMNPKGKSCKLSTFRKTQQMKRFARLTTEKRQVSFETQAAFPDRRFPFFVFYEQLGFTRSLIPNIHTEIQAQNNLYKSIA